MIVSVVRRFVTRADADNMADIILSLVRTARAGYMRDMRRLTVALSRARLGLYMLGRRSVFEQCAEVQPAFELLFQRPDKLQLVVGEMQPTERRVADDVQTSEMDGVEHLGQYVYEMTQAKAKALREEGGELPREEREEGEDEAEDEGEGMMEGEVGGEGEQEEDFLPLEVGGGAEGGDAA